MEERHEDSYTHILKYTGLFGGVQGLNILMGLVRNKIVAVLLGPSGMGLASLFNTALNFISQATNLGVSFSAVRHVSELFDSGDEERVAHYVKIVRAWSLLTCLIGILVCLLAGFVMSNYFSLGDYTLQFVLLAPAVGILAITGGETAILKGTRRLKDLAIIQLFPIFISVLVSVPIYYFYGKSGIVPVIVLLALLTMLFTIRFSFKLYPFKLTGMKGVLGEGMEMVRLGVAFVMAGILGSGAEMLVRSYLSVAGDLDAVGLYNAGYMMIVSYTGVVFYAMETDYFPRLSAICHNLDEACVTINRQIEVSLLMASPMLATLMVCMPLIIPLLFTKAFLPVVAMTQVALFSMYIKAISLPISYITLARGESLAFLLLESVYDVALVLLIIFGYSHWGLWGTGVALTLGYLIDLLVVYGYVHLRFGFRFSFQVMQYAAIQLPLGMAAYVVTFVDNPVIYWLLGSILCFVSIAFSVHVLKQKTSLWASLKKKLKIKIGKVEKV
jgi:O-antigen/teichoic acid export membrane protein